MIEVRTGRLLAHFQVGDGPHEIAASPDGRWAVVTLPGDSRSFSLLGNMRGNKLAVIEVATATLKHTIDLGEYTSPHGIVFLGDNRTVAVTSEPRHSVVLVDIESGALLGAISAGTDAGPYLLALSPDRQRIFTADIERRTVGEIDIAARTLLRTIPAPGAPEGIAVSPDGGTIWVVESLKTRTLSVLDLKTGDTLATFDGFLHPHRVGLSPDGAVALVTDGKGNEVRIYDAINRRELGRVSTGEHSGPNGLFFAPDSKLAYVTLSGGEVAELDPSSPTVLRRFKTTESRPDGIVYIQRE
jgi:DNA-binding beta-propeller fold protein YncE